jgi:hypothetical protein
MTKIKEMTKEEWLELYSKTEDDEEFKFKGNWLLFWIIFLVTGLMTLSLKVFGIWK